jgi:hypothetical protein
LPRAHAAVAIAWNAGDLVVLCTGTPSSSFIVGNHCYAVVGYNASSGQPFEVFNPWGTQSKGYAPGTYNGKPAYGLFTADAAFMMQNFTGQSIGTGSMNVDHIDGAIETLTELNAFSNNSDPLEMICPIRHGLAASVVRASTSLDQSPGPRIAVG